MVWNINCRVLKSAALGWLADPWKACDNCSIGLPAGFTSLLTGWICETGSTVVVNVTGSATVAFLKVL